jgi:hypothetical protein
MARTTTAQSAADPSSGPDTQSGADPKPKALRKARAKKRAKTQAQIAAERLAAPAASHPTSTRTPRGIATGASPLMMALFDKLPVKTEPEAVVWLETAAQIFKLDGAIKGSIAVTHQPLAA